MDDSLGILETTGFTPAMAALDVMEKAAGLRVVQAELNDFLGVCLKVAGPPAVIKTALAAGCEIAERLQGQPVAEVIIRPDTRAWKVIESRSQYNPLIQQDVVMLPSYEAARQLGTQQEPTVANQSSFALGFIETQGFTAVFSAIDTACKAGNVQVLGKEKLGGGYVTVIIKGDVAAVNAAIEAGKEKVDGLGKLIAAYVIPRPSEAVLSLLPKE